MFSWLDGTQLSGEEWKIADLRKIALLICEAVLVPKYTAQFSLLIHKCV